jgi:hypothetical protein
MNAKCTYCGYRQEISRQGIIECVDCGMRFPSSPKYESAVIRNRRNLRWDSIDGVSVDEMEEYGYIWDKMVPITPDTARRIIDLVDVYRLFDDGTELVMEEADAAWDDFMYGIDVDDMPDVVDMIRDTD